MRKIEESTSIIKFQFPRLPIIDLSKTIVVVNPNKALCNNESHIDYKYCDNIRNKLKNNFNDPHIKYLLPTYVSPLDRPRLWQLST